MNGIIINNIFYELVCNENPHELVDCRTQCALYCKCRMKSYRIGDYPCENVARNSEALYHFEQRGEVEALTIKGQ